ncbi:MAG: HDOD domain-containing protein [Rubrivivax sp.]|nr:HDOD domain-containing protein [Rubrivivax sp.]
MAGRADFITQAPRDVAGWMARFDASALPVLAETADQLEALRANEDAVDAHLLAEIVSTDPLMTLKLLAHVAGVRRGRGREDSDAETVTAALVMLGITPFFRAFGPQPTVEDRLADQPEALEGFQRVLRRSHRAANFAVAFAAHRMDHDAPVIHSAALLHDFAELLLWVYAPTLALQIGQRQLADPALRSAAVQRELLHVELADLQHSLMLQWRLPALLVNITDDHLHGDSAQVRNVLLAIRIARHSAAGWDNPALPDDVVAISELLQMGVDPSWRLLLEIDGA